MPIARPGRVLLRDVPLDFVAKRSAGHGRKPLDASLALVPIIDLMICLVVFLLMSFSSSGELVTLPSIKLPKAIHGGDLSTAPVLSVDATVVMLDGRRMADTASLAKDPKIERIEPLIQDLETLHRNWTMLHPKQEFQGALVVQADLAIDYRVIKKLMFNAAQAGYPKVSLAVNKAAAER